MNITDKAVSKWERDLSCPDINSIPKLAETLDISVDELIKAKKSDAPKDGINEIVSIILKVVPLAMGVAVVAISFLGGMDTGSAIGLLAIGMICLGLGALNDRKK